MGSAGAGSSAARAFAGPVRMAGVEAPFGVAGTRLVPLRAVSGERAWPGVASFLAHAAAAAIVTLAMAFPSEAPDPNEKAIEMVFQPALEAPPLFEPTSDLPEPVQPEPPRETPPVESMAEPPEETRAVAAPEQAPPRTDPPQEASAREPMPEPLPPETIPAPRPEPFTQTVPAPPIVRPKPPVPVVHPKPLPPRVPRPGAVPAEDPVPGNPSRPIAPAAPAAAARQPVPSAEPPAAGPLIDPAWGASVRGWLAAHKTYPEESRRRSEEGAVAIRFTVDRSGHVLDASVASGSGSERLDGATLALLRSATFPPFPPAMMAARVTVTTSLRYTLR